MANQANDNGVPTGGLFRSFAPDSYAYGGDGHDNQRAAQGPGPNVQTTQHPVTGNDMQKRYDRILKAFSIEPFDGSSTPGSVDAGAAQWLQRFEALLGTHEDLNGIRLSDNVKNALLFQQIQGTASQWYITNIVELRGCSFNELSRRFKREFGSKLSKHETLILVANERKKAPESYHQFSLRLRSMAAASTADGLETVASNNFALSALISNAWPRHADSLRLIINEDTQNPLREMEHAISRLCTLAKSQGAAPTRLSTGNTSRPIAGKRKYAEHPIKEENNQKGGKRARHEIRDYSKAPRREIRDYSKARCGECGELGYTTGYHDRFVARQQSMAHAAITKEVRPDTNDPDFLELDPPETNE